jgi:hypothetical protein
MRVIAPTGNLYILALEAVCHPLEAKVQQSSII